jgi:hypothetical protein
MPVGMLVGTLVGGIGRSCAGFCVWAGIGNESSDAMAVARIVFIPLGLVSVRFSMAILERSAGRDSY